MGLTNKSDINAINRKIRYTTLVLRDLAVKIEGWSGAWVDSLYDKTEHGDLIEDYMVTLDRIESDASNYMSDLQEYTDILVGNN